MFWHPHPYHGFVVFLITIALLIVPFWRICTRAGYSGWLSLLLVVPMANIAFLYALAFLEWPRDRAPPLATTGMP